MSARSWVRVRASSGPCRARAAAVVRSQIPAAVSAGRCAESQAMPSRSGRNSTRRSAALVVWRSSMLARWWRSARCGPWPGTGRERGPRPGSRGPGPARPGPGSAPPARPPRPDPGAGFVDEDPGVGPGDRPGLQRGQGQRQRRGQGPGVGQEGPGGAFADGQDTGDLGDHGHRLHGAVVRGRAPVPPAPRRPARSRRPASPSARRSGPPAGRPRPARPGNHPPPPATDQRLRADRRRPDQPCGRPGAKTAASAATDAATASIASLLSVTHAALLFTLKEYEEAPTKH